MLKTSHWRDISRAPQLQHMLEVLKAADGPYTTGDTRRALEARGYTIEAIPTVIWEIGQNTGYETSGGVYFKADGKWRYWLIQAPGWTPRWKVSKDFLVVPYNAEEVRSAECGVRSAEHEPSPMSRELETNTCPTCGAETDGGFCSDEHKRAFFERR